MKYLVCNLKNKLTKTEATNYAEKLNEINSGKMELVLLPSYPYLTYFDGKNYNLGSQDISSFSDETITGEITGLQLASLNVSYVLVGHFERRIYKNEINIDFINKINHAQEHGLKVIYCIGESLEDKEKGNTYDVLDKQISEVLNNVELKDIIIAYEPMWAIGTGTSPSLKEIELTIEYIKETIEEKYECNIDVLYGGSINVDNIRDINNINNIDGVLIGEACLDTNNIKNIIENLKENDDE